MRRCAARRCHALERQWLHIPGEPPPGPRLRVLHYNVLADCLARSAGPLSAKRGFRCEEESLDWEHRGPLITAELARHRCDVAGLCEVDRYEDFFEPRLGRLGYDGFFKRKRPPAKDGSAVFWRRGRVAEALRRTVYLEQGVRRTKAAQVAVLQRLNLMAPLLPDGRTTPGSSSRNFVVCATHFRARPEDDDLRLQQASEVVSALQDFSRGEPQIILADVNSDATPEVQRGGAAKCVFEYFLACGYRCAYRSVGYALQRDGGSAPPLPAYTTWAGWATGDYSAVCDHIFVSKGVHVSGVLDVPSIDALAAAYPERLPNRHFPSDHMSLVADLVLE